jgi:hypothetical protein
MNKKKYRRRNTEEKLNTRHSSVATADLIAIGPTAASLPRRRFRKHNPSAGGDQR